MFSFKISLIVILLINLKCFASQDLNPNLITTIEEDEKSVSESETHDNVDHFLNNGKFLSPIFDGNGNNFQNSVFKSRIDNISARFSKSMETMKTKNKKIDVIFLIDSSSSVGKVNFQSELKFVKKLLSDFNVSYNYTRVAIITFSSQAKVIRHVDQITNPSVDNDKCKLLNDDLPVIEFVGGGTFTYGALKEAKKILLKSRLNSRKYIFLVTDGFSNGKNPVQIAEELKKENITIFTIGVKSGNSEELRNISSAPEEYYNFLLDSFYQFEGLARRALRTDYRIDENLILDTVDRCEKLCENNNELANIKANSMKTCCDENAICTCGSSSGHYACVCLPGFYGSGLRENCFACPNGTYWHKSHTCRSCPDINHVTWKYPALSVHDCECKAGFRKTKDNRCEGITCRKLLPPENGYFIKQSASCFNVLNAACGARCKSGFQLIGTSLRLCQEDGSWSGTEAKCVLKSCPRLNVPYYGLIICKNRDLNLFFDYSPRNSTFMEYYSDDTKRITEQLPIDTECTYKCGPGYFLVGSRTRNCLPLSKWDGLQTTCKQVLCPALPRPTYGFYELSDCSEMKVPFGTNCTLLCPEGFTLKGPEMKTCGGKKIGVWSNKNKIPKCVDVTPPSITCPGDLNITSGNDDFVIIKSIPTPLNVSDSSGLEVKYWLKPSINQLEGVKLKIGNHKFTYVAADAFNNKAECYFNVRILDVTPPVVENCIDPEIFNVTMHSNGTQTTKLIEWNEPNFYDNSNQDVTVENSLNFDYLAPGSYEARYIGTDSSNNINICVLNITVRELKCDPVPAPLHGHSVCAKNSTHTWCEVTCKEGYAIFDEAEEFLESTKLMCSNSLPKWEQDSAPNCAKVDLPNNIEHLLTITTDSEEHFCEAKDLQENVKNNLRDQLRLHLCKDSDDDCEIITEIPDCIEGLESNEISEKTFYNIVKRETNNQNEGKKVRSNVRIRLYTKIGKHLGIWRKNVPLSDNIRKIKNEFASFNTNEQLKRVLSDLNIEIKRLKIDELIRCPDGSVLKKHLCVQCPRGTYQDVVFNRCVLCPIGTYNGEVGQVNCNSCPSHHSTRRAGRLSLSDCKEICPPGFVAKVKIPRRKVRPGMLNLNSLMPFCRKCNPGEYQPSYDQTSCLPCPAGYTSSRGTKKLEECVPKSIHPCLRNQNVCSPNGRCVPTPTTDNIRWGSRQVTEGDNQLYSCFCSEGFVGSHCEHRLNLCLSAPCYNNGVCYHINETSIGCKCLPQFTGQYCEDLKDSCSTNIICKNGGICLETGEKALCECPDGFEGDYCEKQINFCSTNPCESGRCINTPDGYECICPPGVIGKRCHLRPCDYFPCDVNSICVDLMHYPAGKDSYVCKCPKGLKGFDCSQVHSPCEVRPCKNNGQCVPKAVRQPGNWSWSADENIFDSYSCVCPPYFYGKNCEILVTPDFVFDFPKADTNSYIKLDGPSSQMNEISFCVWVKTNDGFNYGSIISYATEHNDNSFTFTDYSGFVLYVNGEHVVTDLVINDGLWHFICVAWTKESGFYEIYLDGVLQYTGVNLSANKSLQEKGAFIIGQEQDEMGGSFSESESFVGKMAYFDIWKRFITAAEIHEMYSSCEPYQGDFYAWTDFKSALEGNVKVLPSEFCKNCPRYLALINGYIKYEGDDAIYECNVGYNLVGNSVRHCLRTSQWSKEIPYCEIIDCFEPPKIDNGYLEYSETTYRSRASYQCNEGFSLTGESHRICLENGKWSGVPAKCISKIKCKQLNENNSIKIAYFNEKGYVNKNLTEFPVGTSAEVICTGEDQTYEVFLTCLSDGNWDSEIPSGCFMMKQQQSMTTEQTTRSASTSKKTVFSTTVTLPRQSRINSTPISSTINRGNTIDSTTISARIASTFSSSITQMHTTTTTTARVLTTKVPEKVLPFTPKASTQKTISSSTNTVKTSPKSTIISTTKKPKISVTTSKSIHSTTTQRIKTSSTTMTLITEKPEILIKPDNDFLLNFKKFLFSGCSTSSNLPKSIFCEITNVKTNTNDLTYFETPQTNDFENVDGKLLESLRTHSQIIFDRKEVPFEIIFNLILYGDENPDESIKYSTTMEDTIRFILCLYLDALLWDPNTSFSNNRYDNAMEKDTLPTENITDDLKFFIVKISIPVFEEYKKRLLEISKTQCNFENIPNAPENGMIVRIYDKTGVRKYDLNSIHRKGALAYPGTVAIYGCLRKYKPIGTNKSECGDDATWTSIDYFCDVIGCENPPELENMSYKEADAFSRKHTTGEILHLQCKNGYTIRGNSDIICLSTGKWTKILARCQFAN